MRCYTTIENCADYRCFEYFGYESANAIREVIFSRLTGQHPKDPNNRKIYMLY